MATDFDLLLINPPYHRRRGSGVVFPIGLGYIAAAARLRGYSVDIIDCAPAFASLHHSVLSRLGPWLKTRLEASRPRLAIGIGPCTTSSVRGTQSVAAVCQSVLPGIPLIYGGPLASLPGQTSLFFDHLSASAVVPGDGDFVICDILGTLASGGDLARLSNVTTKGRVASCNLIGDLDALPFPDRQWEAEGAGYSLSVRRELNAGGFATMIRSRGCPHRCKFCVSGYLRDGQYTTRSLRNVVAEIDQLQQSRNVKAIVFYDDTFFLQPGSLRQEISEIAQLLHTLSQPVVWQAEIRPDVMAAIDSPTAESLYASGCRQLNVGIEKANTPHVGLLGKQIDIDLTKKAIDQIRRGAPNLRLTGTFILGGPGETRESVNATLELAKELGLIFAHFYPLEVYPGTDIYKECFPCDGEVDWLDRILTDELPWGELIYESPSLTRADLLNLVKQGYQSFYERAEWHSLAHRLLGAHYTQCAQAVAQWAADRFGFAQEGE